MTHSRPIVGGATPGAETYRQNYDRIFGPKPGARCETCGRKLGRLEFAYCAEHATPPDR